MPALRMGAVAGTLGVLAAAASYRLSVLLLEKVMPSEAAALTATLAYGGGAGCAAMVTLRRLRETPAPLPVDTARRFADAIADREAPSEVEQPPGRHAPPVEAPSGLAVRRRRPTERSGA